MTRKMNQNDQKLLQLHREYKIPPLRRQHLTCSEPLSILLQEQFREYSTIQQIIIRLLLLIISLRV